MRHAVLIAACLLTLASAVRAQSQDDAAWKREMERKIDVLTQELESQRLSGSAAPPAAPAAGSEAAPATTLSPYSLGPSAGKVYGVDKGLALGGYGEFTYQNFQHATASSLNSDEKEPRTAEADLARFVLYVGYRFSDKILLDSELEVEHGNTSKSGEMGVEFAY